MNVTFRLPDFGLIKGQETAKRAAEIAVAGRHSLLLIGPMGCGKTMLIEAAAAMCVVEIRPELHTMATAEHRELRRGMDAGQLVFADSLEALEPGLMDRFPIVVRMAATSAADLLLPPPCENSADIRNRLAKLSTADLRMTTPALQLLRSAAEKLNLTARAFEHVRAVALTIARMNGTEPGAACVAEALSYRGAS